MPYAVPGVGAIATQASAHRQFGPKAIALLEQGLTPAEVVTRITATTRAVRSWPTPPSRPSTRWVSVTRRDTAKALEQLALAIRRQPVQWKAQAAADPFFAPLKSSATFQRIVAP